MCTGRVDLSFILRAFSNGADGVFIGGCWPGECHYVTEGNYDALGTMHIGRKLMDQIGLHPERLRLEWMSAAEGTRFAEVMNDFIAKLRELGPVENAAGTGAKTGSGTADVSDRNAGAGAADPAANGLGLRLKAATRLVPYLKLVERERLRVPTKSEEAYNTFYASDEVDRLFRGLVGEKLAVSQMLLLLEEGPRSTAEIAATLDLNPAMVARQMNASSRQGLVRYDVEQRRYALA
jgi:coenzyme F420-reducing hydrogenase delta subunit